VKREVEIDSSWLGNVVYLIFKYKLSESTSQKFIVLDGGRGTGILGKMNASGKLRIFIVICVLFVTRSEVRSKKTPVTSRLNIEEGNGGSGDPVRKVIEKSIVPDDTEASGVDSDGEIDGEPEEGSGVDGSGGEGSGGGSGVLPTNMTVNPTSIQTVVVINNGDGSTTASTTIVGTTAAIDNTVEKPVKIEHFNESGNEIPEPDVGQSAQPEDAALASSGVNFTVAIIVGVVVGAILSILIIVFLVYRLRKKDEGSYSLDEQSSAMLRADTDSPPPKGKEEYYA